jgi:1-acyl-sn-glycerol-3-phosphate acyltransferase
MSAYSSVITRIAGWTASVFYRLERTGRPIPAGPVLVVANHPNSLLDPLIVFRTAGRITRPLAKAPLFDQALIGSVLRALGGLPVYRRQDDDAQMHRNEETFRKAIEALQAGDAVQIYPEGISHSGPALVPLRTGAARIALGAELASDWKLGLQIVPVGITYRRKPFFRGTALATLGEPFTIARLREQYAADPAVAVRVLTEEIRENLERLTINLSRTEDQDLIDTAERVYARAKGLAGWRERDPLSERLPRLQAFARGLAWLRLNDPERLTRLETEVKRYRTILERLGAAEGDVPPSYRFFGVLRYVLREVLVLGLGLPLAAMGTAIWAPAYFAPRFIVARIRPAFEAIATYKLSTAFFAMPITVIVCVTLAWMYLGARAALATLVVVPALGFLALAWRERWHRVREDARLFLRVLRHPRSPARLDAQRGQLVQEFDDIATLVTPPVTA